VDVLTIGNVVEGDSALGAQALALRAAQERHRQRQRDRVVGPRRDIELVEVHIGARQLLVARPGLVDLPRLDLDVVRGRHEALHAGAMKRRGEPQAHGVSRRRP
jgi:hypothetical protein